MSRESDTPPVTLGSETEFGLYTPEDFLNSYSRECVLVNRLLHSRFDIVKSFTPTAGRFYFDFFSKSIGKQQYADGSPEYATPECQSPEELAVYEIAGEDLAYRALSALRDSGFFSQFQANKRTINNRGKAFTRAAHENIQIPRTTFYHPYFEDTMGLYLSTRGLLVGAGTMRNHQYWVSQKLPTIGTLWGLDTVTNKPLISDARHEEEDVDPRWMTDYMRYEIVSGDSNMSPWAIRMKHGMNMLIMKAIEAEIDFDDVYPQNTLGTAHTVARDPTMRKKVRVRDGKRVEPMDLQFELLGRLQAELPKRFELNKDERWTLNEWAEALDELDIDPQAAAMRGVEWLARMRYLERHGLGERQTRESITQLHDKDFKWDALGPYGEASKLRQKGWAGYGEIRRKVLRAKDTPPSHPRAQERAEFLKGKKPEDIDEIGWDIWKAA